MKLGFALMLGMGLLWPSAWAQGTIQSIEFEGNETTQPSVMLREMVLQVGDPADPQAIERSRQGILDLGLFESVEVRSTTVAGGVQLTFVVEEKWYLLPIPRLDANTEGERAYGLALRWYNVWGLNHSLRANWSRRDEAMSDRGQVRSYHVGYSMPFVFNSPYRLGLSFGHSEAPISDPVDYTEVVDSLSLGVTRTFSTGPASAGWTVGTSLSWSGQSTVGLLAPAPYGEATSLGLNVGYADVRYKVYSDEGIRFGVSTQSAVRGLGSDYSYNNVSAQVTRYLPLGETPHQSLHLIAEVGSYHGGPQELTSYDGIYNLGGSSRMRGYPSNEFVGDAYYYLSAEALRPVFWKWLRLLALVEVGDVYEDAHAARLYRIETSVGLGVRIRVSFLVNLDIELGFAVPLEGGSVRFFASKV